MPPRAPAGGLPRGVVAVAFSGGRDSTALLHVTSRVAKAWGLEVVALHVHHGLMPQADAWAEHAMALARRWGLRGQVHRLEGRPGRGESVEAWARRERYAVLASMARHEGASIVLLAQHRRDQAETVLLQLLRGAGVHGLAAMPRFAVRQGLCWARPWLDLPREAIENYLRQHRLPAVEDGSNVDPRFARARLRTAVWPSLTASFPDAEVALAAAARHAQASAALADEVAAEDLRTVTAGEALDVARWLALTPARRHNALRAWLAAGLSSGVPASLLQRLLHDVPATRSGRWPCGGGMMCRLYRGRLTLQARTSGDVQRGPVPQTKRGARSAPEGAGQGRGVDLSRLGRHRLPDWGGTLVVTAAASGQGVPATLLKQAELRARRGGERFAIAVRGMARSLKKQFQARGVPEEARQGPLVYADGRLVFVPGLGMDAAACALACEAPSRARRRIRWEPDA